MRTFRSLMRPGRVTLMVEVTPTELLSGSASAGDSLRLLAVPFGRLPWRA